MSEYKTIVIHTGNIVEYWDPILLNDKRISGSEIMAVNLAKEFTKYNYRVFVIGSFQNKNVNYEGIDNSGVEYIDLEYFTEFALNLIEYFSNLLLGLIDLYVILLCFVLLQLCVLLPQSFLV